MSGAIAPISSSLEALTDQYRTITENLANANTTGYKRRVTAFQQALASSLATTAPGGAATISNVTDRTSIDFTQGSMARTEAPLDLALDGSGLFVLETPTGPLYTRHGSFSLNSSNQLVDRAGRLVGGEGGPITIPTTVSLQNVSIDRDGTVAAEGKAIGKVKIVQFQDPTVLTPVGGNCYAAPKTAQQQPATAALHQGYQEGSNVNVVEEMVGLITVSRMYEANLKNVHAQDEQSKNLLGAVK